ncbi:hypothetical protein MWN34_18935 [Ancylobacter sp. 6x-1]|uniref:Uncharacterized protein n=1 Tax=Ancylobacter crimeensis TaxID=2579147 RepID=A0ABT0DG94_9HYPH|nr:hypothetical protein [Ancylobacter crimeensis]MCK0198978.1 hypothetical protein [Ancylobacter crimeensis]
MKITFIVVTMISVMSMTTAVQADPVIAAALIAAGPTFGTAAGGLTVIGTIVSTGIQIGLAVGAPFIPGSMRAR